MNTNTSTMVNDLLTKMGTTFCDCDVVRFEIEDKAVTLRCSLPEAPDISLPVDSVSLDDRMSNARLSQELIRLYNTALYYAGYEDSTYE